MKHSIILGSYNRPRYVRHALMSVMKQTLGDWQLVITDDGSTEETLRIIDKEIGRDPRVTLLVHDHDPIDPTPANVRAVERINDAIPYVTGDWVHYLPDDDFYELSRLESFERAIARYPNAHMIYGRLYYANPDGTPDPKRGIFPGRPVTNPVCVLDQTQVTHRRACFERVAKWSTEGIEYAADGYFYRDLVRAGYGPIWPFSATVSYHRDHALNLIKTQHNTTATRE